MFKDVADAIMQSAQAALDAGTTQTIQYKLFVSDTVRQYEARM